MKKCSKCQKEKPLTDFNKNKSKKDGLQNACRQCHCAEAAKYYRNNTEEHKKRVKAGKRTVTRRNKDFLLSYLKTHPCIDCGEPDPVVLELDHVRGQKTDSVCNMVMKRNLSLKKVQEELTKCDVRCANCHRRKTAKDFGYFRYTNS